MALTFEDSTFNNVSSTTNTISSQEELFSEDEDTDDCNATNNSIKVFLRVRPIDPICSKYHLTNDQLIIEANSKQNELYHFTKILNRSTQMEVFEDCTLPLLKDFVSGSNSLLCTYGVTSSGKSYTIKGTASQPGVLPLSLMFLFDSFKDIIVDKVPEYKPDQYEGSLHLIDDICKQNEFQHHQTIIDKSCLVSSELFNKKQTEILKSNDNFSNEIFEQFDSSGNFEIGIWISYFEIYNESIYDLLDHQIDAVKHKVQRDTNENYFVKDLKQIYVTSALEAYQVFLYGQNSLRQHIAETKLNRTSSRSHSIFKITLIRVDYDERQIVTSNMAFCDLAGAERCKKTSSKGLQLVESSKINNSLMSLNRCIRNLRLKQKYVF